MFGKHAPTGLSKFVPVDCTVMTRGSFSPSGSGPGSRSGGTGAIPTMPPRVPFSLNSEFKIDRNDWGMTYGKGKIDDLVEVKIAIAAKK